MDSNNIKLRSNDDWPCGSPYRACQSEANLEDTPILENDYDNLQCNERLPSVGSDCVFASPRPTKVFNFGEGNRSAGAVASSSGSSALFSSDLSSLNSSALEAFRGQSVTNEKCESLSGPDLKGELNDTGGALISPTSPETMIKPTKSKDPTEPDPFEDNEVIFKLKKWTHVSLWKWDVDCDICAICRVVICDPCLTVRTD